MPEAAGASASAVLGSPVGDTRGRDRSRRRRRRRRLIVVAALVVMVAIAAAWLVYRGRQARAELRVAGSLVGTMQDQLRSRDVTGAQVTLAELQRTTAAARDKTSDPIWPVAGAVPWLGDNVSAVRELTVAADDLAVHVLPGLVDAAKALDPQRLAPVGGRIDLAPIVAAAPGVVAGNSALQAVVSRVSALSKTHITGTVRAAVDALSLKLGLAEAETATAARAVTLLPPMLGASGPRTYLLVFQNLAEVRATGGIWGAWATVHAENGRLTLPQQGSGAQINAKLSNVVVNPELAQLYGNRISQYFQDANLTADFPTAAQLGREMFRQAYGQLVDGVIATDPVALSYLLKGSPPVDLPGGRKLTADNAVRLLLNDVYLTEPDPVRQDAIFSAASAHLFSAIAGGSNNGASVLEGVRLAASQQRLLVWSSVDAEETLLSASTLAGSLDGPAAPDVGLFLNDGTGAKMDYYLHETVVAAARGCTTDTPILRVTTTLTSAAPTTALPAYVTGGGQYGVPAGTFRTNLTLVAQRGGGVVQALVDSVRTPLGSGIDRGRQVSVITLDLAPGQRKTVEFDVAAPYLRDPGFRPTIRTSPTIDATSVLYSGC